MNEMVNLKRERPRAGRSIDRLPPNSPESEQGVLGCVLLSPKETLSQCIEKFGTGEVFYDLRHQAIYEALVAMYDAAQAIDIITLQQWLKDKGLLEKVGGISYLSSLPDTVPSAANLEYYAQIVKEKYLLRKVIHVCTDTVGKIYDFEGDVEALLDTVERDILAVNSLRIEGKDGTMRELVKRVVDTIEANFERKGACVGLSTGFVDLDRLTGGLSAGDMFVLAARPSVGKSSLAMNIAEHVTMELNQAVGVFSLEMTSESLVMRVLCSNSRVNLRNVRDGFLAERDFPRITGSAGKLIKAPLVIDDTGGLSILQLRAKARRMRQQYDVRLFVIDYLQLLHSTSKRNQNREQEVSDISRGIKALAKELDVPIIVLSQLNRDIEKGKTRKPRLSDLRESGSIEQDADLVGLLYGADDDDDLSNADVRTVNLRIAKQRNGETGEVQLTFLKPFTRFESAAKVEE